MISLTGSHEQVARAARAYRVYYSRPPRIQGGKDYLVGHSIFIYLMGHNGQFVDCYGKNFSTEYVANSVGQYIRKGQRGGVQLVARPKDEDAPNRQSE